MIDRVASWIRRARRLAILTGAGISAESGVPVFRGAGGLWRQFRPEQLATPEAFARQPELVWEWYLWRRARIAAAQPNAGHDVIARWQATRDATLLTQNVDGLHARAGSRQVIELHGNLWRVKCADRCGVIGLDDPGAPPRTALRCTCGAWLRPDVVWFGEMLDAMAMEEAAAAVAAADVVLVVGTSAMVYPVAALPQLALDDLQRVPGVGQPRAARVLAAVELGRRAVTQRGAERPQLRSPRALGEYLLPLYGGHREERFGIVLLDAKYRLIRSEIISVGTLDSSLAHPREVFRAATVASAFSIALFHNHPSGDPTPSHDDVALTARLAQAGELMSIKVVDHIILGAGSYYSFRNAGVLP